MTESSKWVSKSFEWIHINAFIKLECLQKKGVKDMNKSKTASSF